MMSRIRIPWYTITFNSEGGSSVDSQTIEEGKKVTKPKDPTKADHKFLAGILVMMSLVLIQKLTLIQR